MNTLQEWCEIYRFTLTVSSTAVMVYAVRKIVSRKRESYQTESRTYVLFMFEIDDECTIVFKSYQLLKKYVIGCHLGYSGC